MNECYPLLLQPLLFEKVWGGDRLARFGKAVKPGSTIGESWELADMHATSSSGAGGGAARSPIAAGPLTGRTLGDALAAWGPKLLGSAAATPAGEFPLLVKFLDARENLSVQVHPSPAYARANPGAKLKTECWYVLDATPGSMIYKGVRAGTTPEEFAKHVIDGTVVNDLMSVPAVPGECHNLPSGTVHALGAGVLVAEVQTPSDTTFRVFDWGRKGRELHVQQAMQCIDFGPAPQATAFHPGETATRLVTTEFFKLDEIRPATGTELTVGYGNGCFVIIVLSGHASLRSRDGFFSPLKLSPGDTTLVPAAVAPGSLLRAGEGVRLLRVALGV